MPLTCCIAAQSAHMHHALCCVASKNNQHMRVSQLHTAVNAYPDKEHMEKSRLQDMHIYQIVKQLCANAQLDRTHHANTQQCAAFTLPMPCKSCSLEPPSKVTP
jgi:hypothetical protein